MVSLASIPLYSHEDGDKGFIMQLSLPVMQLKNRAAKMEVEKKET